MFVPGPSWDPLSPPSRRLTRPLQSSAWQPFFMDATKPSMKNKRRGRERKERKALKGFCFLSSACRYSLINLPLWKFYLVVLVHCA